MKNYRVTFTRDNLNVSYWDTLTPFDKISPALKHIELINFEDINNYYFPAIKKIIDKSKSLGIVDIWFFYELDPTIEITWLSNSAEVSSKLHKYVEGLCKRDGFVDLKYLTPADGKFGDWYHAEGNEREREFGAKRHAICCQFVQLYNKYQKDVDSGKGLDNQVKRTIHTLCNPLGLNYNREAQICLERFLECKSFQGKFWGFLYRFYIKYIHKKYFI